MCALARATGLHGLRRAFRSAKSALHHLRQATARPSLAMRRLPV
jgi:hypothetical protein